MQTLFEEVDSPANGVIFCQGKSQLAGDDLSAAVRAFGERTFMVHIRDIVTRVTDPVDPELRKRLEGMGYLEVAFGTAKWIWWGRSGR
jgi:D-mannonate dehydratase